MDVVSGRWAAVAAGFAHHEARAQDMACLAARIPAGERGEQYLGGFLA
jgi:hypothetical protein